LTLITSRTGDGAAQLFWVRSELVLGGGRYDAVPTADGLGWNAIDLGATLQAGSYLELEAKLRLRRSVD
jgi:hypothetical protein